MTFRHARIWCDIGLLLSVLFLPWYISIVIMLAGYISFRSYYEAIVGVLVWYVLYAGSAGDAVSTGRMKVAVAIVFLAVLIYIKDAFIRER